MPKIAPYDLISIVPANYAHMRAFDELIETLQYAFLELGLELPFRVNDPDPKRPAIVIGAHFLEKSAIEHLHPESILYNAEQMEAGSLLVTKDYLDLLRSFQVWDFSQENMPRLQRENITKVTYVPLGYVPQMSRIPTNAGQDIDVLLYGSLGERRRDLLVACEKRGLKTHFLFDVYGEERDQVIGRSKVILNVHRYDKGVFESIRVAYLLANQKAVVCEVNAGEILPEAYEGAVCAVPYEQMLEACVRLVQNEAARKTLEKEGLQKIQSHKMVDILQTVLKLGKPKKAQAIPLLLNIGSGRNFREDCLNADISARARPDLLVNIATPDLIGKTFTTHRFGKVTFTNNLFDEIIAEDVLEHIMDLTSAMTNCLALLKPGGLFRIFVPYDLSCGAWQDPTHVRGFNEQNWQYFTAPIAHYIGWTEACFDILSVELVFTDLGQKLSAEGQDALAIARVPRAVTHMRVVLQKRYLQRSEKERANTLPARAWD